MRIHPPKLIAGHPGDRPSTRRSRARIPAVCNTVAEVSQWLQTQVAGVVLRRVSEQEAEAVPAFWEEAIACRTPPYSRPARVLLLAARLCPYPLPRELQILALLSPDASSRKERQRGDLEGHYAVIGRQGDPEMVGIFSAFDSRREYGPVWLVGFGPGDPSLMTLRAHDALRSADAILYDDLIDRSVLCRYRARMIYAGKRKGRSQGRQATINRMLYQAALRGETAVRLKGGDPLVLARGGEEIEHLERRFVSVQVVPGVTSALAAAADFEIPLTRRGVSSGLTIGTGHSAYPGQSSRACETLVFYMAASRLAQLGEELAQAGFDPNLPAAVVERASLPERKCWMTTVGNLKNLQSQGPAVLIVGKSLEAVRQRPTLLYTGIFPYRFRGPERLVHYPLIARVRNQQGATSRDCPASRPFALRPLDQPRIDLRAFQGVVFTHELAVNRFLQIWGLLPKLVYATNRAVWRRLIQEGAQTTVISAF